MKNIQIEIYEIECRVDYSHPLDPTYVDGEIVTTREEKIEGLTDEQIALINARHEADVIRLKAGDRRLLMIRILRVGNRTYKCYSAAYWKSELPLARKGALDRVSNMPYPHDIIDVIED